MCWEIRLIYQLQLHFLSRQQTLTTQGRGTVSLVVALLQTVVGSILVITTTTQSLR